MDWRTWRMSTSNSTAIKGIAAILLEMVDVNDPIEVRHDETYIITITNQGSADNTNVKIVCTLEDAMQYVSSSGVTAGAKDAANTITFQPLPRLAPKEKAVWKVVVKAQKPGDIRFKVDLTCDQTERPVIKTESTHFYE